MASTGADRDEVVEKGTRLQNGHGVTEKDTHLVPNGVSMAGEEPRPFEVLLVKPHTVQVDSGDEDCSTVSILKVKTSTKEGYIQMLPDKRLTLIVYEGGMVTDEAGNYKKQLSALKF